MKKKSAIAFEKIEDVALKIIDAFENCPEIKQVLFTVGATTISPKESYVVELPPLNPEADNLSSKKSVKTLFQQIIIQDPLCKLKQISPTNVSVLFYGPRQTNLPWFLPKPMYKIPTRCRKFEFQLSNSAGPGNHDLTQDYALVEISGLEALDVSILDSSADEPQVGSPDYENMDVAQHSQEDSRTDMPKKRTMDTGTETGHNWSVSGSDTSYTTVPVKKSMKKSDSCSSILSQSSVMQQSPSQRSDLSPTDVFSFTEPEHIWYQLPITIKGYRA